MRGCGMWSGRKKRGILLVEPYREAFLRAGVTANQSGFTNALCWVGLTMQHMQNVNVYKVGLQWSSLFLFILGTASRQTKPNIEIGLWGGEQSFFLKSNFSTFITVEKFWVIKVFFLKIIQQKHIKLTKSDSKDMYKYFQKYIYFK